MLAILASLLFGIVPSLGWFVEEYTATDVPLKVILIIFVYFKVPLSALLLFQLVYESHARFHEHIHLFKPSDSHSCSTYAFQGAIVLIY